MKFTLFIFSAIFLSSSMGQKIIRSSLFKQPQSICGGPVDFADSMPQIALSVADFGAGTSACGQCVTVMGPQGSVTGRVTAQCPADRCPMGMIYLNKQSAMMINAGPLSPNNTFDGDWMIVPCPPGMATANANATSLTVSGTDPTISGMIAGNNTQNVNGGAAMPNGTMAEMGAVDPGEPPMAGNNGTNTTMSMMASVNGGNSTAIEGKIMPTIMKVARGSCGMPVNFNNEKAYVAVSFEDFKPEYCGKMVRVKAKDGEVEAKIVSSCRDGCGPNIIQLSLESTKKIYAKGPGEDGTFPGTWTFV